MSFTIERNGYTSVQMLGQAIANDFIANGFALAAVNETDVSPTVSDASTKYLFEPQTSLDNIDNTWRLAMEASDDTDGFIRFWACNELQINDTFTVVFNSINGQSGHMFDGNNVAEPTAYFVARNDMATNWSCFKTGADPRAIPLSYRMSISNHGISLFIWAEGFDKAGDCMSWFTIQRPVAADGTVVSTGKLPLFCVFSVNGGGADDMALSEDLSAVQRGILKFVVQESDVNAPTLPQSAVMTGPDSKAIMNPIQQVALAEDNEFVISFPQGINTQRYSYPYELDMVAYTSADVISQNQVVDITLYGEATPRKYIGMAANFPNNTGMRMLCLIQGAGITS